MSRRNHATRPRQPDTSEAVLRIIGGQWRSRKVSFPEIEGLRPTPDRVRETLFNWLQGVTDGARCLDLCAGSGALGLEALSRGAASVTFVDRSPQVARALQANLQLLKAQNAEVITAAALDWLDARPTDESERFDLVFMDPPFRQGLIAPLCALLESRNLLAARAMIYIECERELTLPPLPSDWQLYREKQAGQVSYRLYERLSEH
ncbi:MAG: 16S rRNA (guanine(966)-N(2))-methyltransferase RsmD [Oceanospirillales bacterium]|nr:16S rRNA (guanine(966)-N(2))-methyltransferase RsmD [Oceanospirillales bacterium]